ncbi:MAG: hypothetical protein FWC83_00560 [Alphaproteobacteria bacterium]|nr:hypothetical protein [Alphaproteobacteria bacterium]
MKKLLLIMPILFVSTVATILFVQNNKIQTLTAERDMYRIYAHEPEMRPGQTHYMQPDMFFDADGYVLQDWVFESDLPCLNPNADGRVARADWDHYQNFWLYNTPEPEINMCEQALSRGWRPL